MRARIQPGLLTVQAAAALNETLRRVEELDRKLTPKENLPIYYEQFPAKITAVSAGKYSWTEQFYDNTGAYVNMPNGRTGTATVSPAYERNGATATSFPFYVQLMRRVSVSGFPVYEFDAGNGSGAGGTIATGKAFLEDGYPISTSGVWEDTGLGIALPSAGTYLLIAEASWNIEMSGGNPGRILFEFYNDDDSSSIPEAVTAIQTSAEYVVRGLCTFHTIYEATAADTIIVRAFRQNLLGTYVTSLVEATESMISYTKLA